jgi:hypothetical protein
VWGEHLGGAPEAVANLLPQRAAPDEQVAEQHEAGRPGKEPPLGAHRDPHADAARHEPAVHGHVATEREQRDREQIGGTRPERQRPGWIVSNGCLNVHRCFRLATVRSRKLRRTRGWSGRDFQKTQRDTVVNNGNIGENPEAAASGGLTQPSRLRKPVP